MRRRASGDTQVLASEEGRPALARNSLVPFANECQLMPLYMVGQHASQPRGPSMMLKVPISGWTGLPFDAAVASPRRLF